MFGSVSEYVVRATPAIAPVEESTSQYPDRYALGSRWNATKASVEAMCQFEIKNLVPGMQYNFQVVPRHTVMKEVKEMITGGSSLARQASGAAGGPRGQTSATNSSAEAAAARKQKKKKVRTEVHSSTSLLEDEESIHTLEGNISFPYVVVTK